MTLWIDADGSTYLKNNSKTETFKIDGYSIASEHNDLLWQDYDGVKGWRAFEDIPTQFPDDISKVSAQFGAAALSMGSANPNAGNLSELTLNANGLEFNPGESWFIGKPFTVLPCGPDGILAGYAFAFKTTDSTQQQNGSASFCVPEPSGWLLAGLGGLGLAAFARRARAKA